MVNYSLQTSLFNFVPFVWPPLQQIITTVRIPHSHHHSSEHIHTNSYHLLTIYWTSNDMITNITSFKPDLTRKSNPIQLQAAQTYSIGKKKKVLWTIHNTCKMHKISDNTPTNKEQLFCKISCLCHGQV